MITGGIHAALFIVHWEVYRAVGRLCLGRAVGLRVRVVSAPRGSASGGSGSVVTSGGCDSPSTCRTAGSAASAIAAWPSAVGWIAPP